MFCITRWCSATKVTTAEDSGGRSGGKKEHLATVKERISHGIHEGDKGLATPPSIVPAAQGGTGQVPRRIIRVQHEQALDSQHYASKLGGQLDCFPSTL